MKKTLIAIAALAATGAFAQSSVTIAGTADVGYVAYDMKGHKVTGFAQNLSATSGMVIRGTGDLGGGLKMNFLTGTDFSFVSNGANTGTVSNAVTTTSPTNANAASTMTSNVTNGTAGTWGNAQQFLNIQGGFGKLGFGVINNIGLDAHSISQPFGTAIGSGFRATSTSAANAGATANVRNDNTLRFDSASFGGASLSYLARKQQAGAASTNYNSSFGAQNQSTISELALNYNAGPLNAIVARSMEDATNIGANVAAGTAATVNTFAYGNKGVLNMLAANYNFGAATVYAGWQGQKSTNSNGVAQRDTTAINIAGKYVMGANSFMANYGRLTGATSAANVGVNSGATTLLGFGYEYALAKNAAIVARYERLSDNAFTGVAATTGYASVTGNQDRNRMGLGMRYAF